MRIALLALLLSAPALAIEKVCADVQMRMFPHDQFGDTDWTAKPTLTRENVCIRISDDRKTASASRQVSSGSKPFVYADLTWEPKKKRWLGAIDMELGRVVVGIADKETFYRFLLIGQGAEAATFTADVPKP